jgi:cytidylate kinase
VVTLAALYGAGGSIVGPRVAERLAVPFFDRAVPKDVADRAGVADGPVTAPGEHPHRGVERLVDRLARVTNPTTATGLPVERVELEERRAQAELEHALAYAARSGVVVLGLGGAIVLRSAPGALHVLLHCREDDRISAVVEREGVDRKTAEQRVRANDRARRDYVRDAYGVDGEDPGLYHLAIDAVALGVDACVELIVAASSQRRLA